MTDEDRDFMFSELSKLGRYTGIMSCSSITRQFPTCHCWFPCSHSDLFNAVLLVFVSELIHNFTVLRFYSYGEKIVFFLKSLIVFPCYCY